jgi:hypothetical protein
MTTIDLQAIVTAVVDRHGNVKSISVTAHDEITYIDCGAGLWEGNGKAHETVAREGRKARQALIDYWKAWPRSSVENNTDTSGWE